MFDQCADPSNLDRFAWLMCYVTSGKHLLFYKSFGTVLLLLAVTAPVAMLFGFIGALARRSSVAILRWGGIAYTSLARGVPDIVFFLFVPIALDQGLEWLRHKSICGDTGPIRVGREFRVCAEAKLPLSGADQWVHDAYGFSLAVVAFALVFGAFAANVLHGAMQAVPHGQLETGAAYGMSSRQVTRRILIPQMWIYALPGLGNLWMILVKSTPLLFLLGIEDIVYWARELGGSKSGAFTYPHPDWRLWYFLVILAFYLLMTAVSEATFARLTARLSKGHRAFGRTADNATQQVSG